MVSEYVLEARNAVNADLRSALRVNEIIQFITQFSQWHSSRAHSVHLVGGGPS